MNSHVIQKSSSSRISNGSSAVSISERDHLDHFSTRNLRHSSVLVLLRAASRYRKQDIFFVCVCARETASLNEGLTKLHSAPSNFALNGLCHSLGLSWGFPLPVSARKKGDIPQKLYIPRG
ncbi:hypothetical protein ISCGN_024205 [Ixodes scapularis]